MIDSLRTYLRQAAALSYSLGLLEWDEHVNMPEQGMLQRAQAKAELAALAHARYTAPELGKMLEDLRKPTTFAKLSERDQALVREAWRDYEQATKLPVEYVRELQEVTTTAFEAWRQAREQADFAIFAPHLEKIVALKKQEAEYLGYQESPYDALLDEYEPGMTEAKVRQEFAKLRDALQNLVRRIAAAPQHHDPAILAGEFPLEKQAELGRRLAQQVGYNLKAGHMAVSPHPFEMPLSPLDVRITSRYKTHDVTEGLTATLHETGHALYDQGMPADDFGTPLAQAVSLAIHESQSRMWENLVGRSEAFWQYAYPLLQEYFPKPFAKLSLAEFLPALNAVQPGFIRIESDEVTYSLHVILRFELETDLIAGRLEVKDLPAAWNQKMRDYLGLEVPNDALGLLQDMHWANGVLGYFPTYALGNIFSAQFFQAAEKALPNLHQEFAKGNFKSLREWLRENIHRYGRQYSAEELVQRATGEGMNSDRYIAYLTEKYSRLYKLED